MTSTRRQPRAKSLTATVLTGIGCLHIAWGNGSSFPFRNTDDLADAVIGSGDVPPPAACFAVGGALLVAAALVADLPIAPTRIRRVGRVGVAAVLGARAAIGLTNNTRLISPASTSARVRSLDRRIFSPLCLGLALGTMSNF